MVAALLCLYCARLLPDDRICFCSDACARFHSWWGTPSFSLLGTPAHLPKGPSMPDLASAGTARTPNADTVMDLIQQVSTLSKAVRGSALTQLSRVTIPPPPMDVPGSTVPPTLPPMAPLFEAYRSLLLDVQGDLLAIQAAISAAEV